MALDPAQRIAMIQEIAAALGQREWSEINLILEQFGFPTAYWSDWADAEMTHYARAMVKDASDDLLATLQQYVAEQTQTAAVTSGPWQPDRLHLFMIHLASQRDIVGNVRRRLERFGIDAFVAHDSIEPSHEWVDVIEGALRTCHAAVAFLHEGFGESVWTDQEIGFCLARRVPILPLTFEVLPTGFLARFQAAKCAQMDESAITKVILDWLVDRPATQTHMTEGIVAAMVESTSWNHTRAVWPYLERVPSLTPEQMQRLEQAAQTNVDVREAIIDRVAAPNRIRDLIQRHSGIKDEGLF
jgi:hypothetical protein